MASVALNLVGSLVDSPTGLSDFIRLGLSPELFKGPTETGAWDLLHGFICKYGAVPSRERFIEIDINLPAANSEPVDWYADQIKSRHAHQLLKQTLYDAQELLNSDKPEQTLSVLTDTVMKLTRANNKNKILDFSTEGKELVFTEMKAKKLAGDDYGLKFGWPTLDDMAGGLTGGDLITIVGKSGQGKTFAMLYTASHAWKKQGKKPMFVSMEIKLLPLAQRLAALNAGKPITQIKKAELSTANEKDLAAKMDSYKDLNQFWLVDGALTSKMSDIILLARQLKPDVVWIDGAYLVRSNNPKAPRWDRVTEIVEMAKGDLAEALNIPVVISFQFNRKQKKGEEGNLDNIALSDSVGQLSSLVLGLGLLDDENSVESLSSRRIQVLKGRSGEVGEFNIKWSFEYPNPMDFTEVKQLNYGDMQFGAE